jgi:tetratricopeptide (TPR) repeat protein
MEKNTLAPCVNWQKKLAVLHPDDLSPAERADLGAHMVGCPECTAVFGDYNKIDSLIREAFVCEKPLELPQWLIQEDLAEKLSKLPVPYQNLPPRFHHFLGRQAELRHVLESLNSPHSPLVIGGVSGIGKTTLALEAAYQCLQRSDLTPHPLFDAVVWISASGRWNKGYWLSEVLGAIALVLDHRHIAQLSLQEKCIKVNELLRRYRTLVIVDDFDTTDDDALLSWIREIPQSSKILVISHDMKPFHQAQILRLEGLKKNDALDLISHCVQKLDLRVLESTEINNLFHITHGNPQAIAMTLGYVKSDGLSLHQALGELHGAEDILAYLFTRIWRTLERLPNAQRILLAMSLFEGSVSEEALRTVAEVDNALLGEALTQLMELSLIEVYDDKTETQVRYGLHPLAHSFANNKLKEEPNWEQQFREPWIDWWLDFTKVHGGPDGIEWAEHYGLINEERVNLSLVFEWCVAHGRYKVLQALWHSERLLWMTSVYGCWKLRLTWLRQIGKDAEMRGDKATTLQAIVEQGFSLMQIGRMEEAGEMLKEAWEQNHLLSLGVQTTLAENLVQWHMRNNNFTSAQHWLEKAARLVRNLNRLERPRHSLTVQYYYGVMYIAKGDRKQAERCFNQTLKDAREIGWQRCVIYVEQFLVDIAKAKGMFDETKDLLKKECSLAYLALLQLWQNYEEISRTTVWAQRFLKSINHLETQPEVLSYHQAAPSSPSVCVFF